MLLRLADDMKEVAVFFVLVGLFLGLAYGFYLNNIPMGMFIGIGVGFLLAGITRVIKIREGRS